MAFKWDIPRGAKTWSYTRLDTFTCPWRYQEKYIKKAQEPVSEALHLGRLGHDIINRYIGHLVDSGLDTDVTTIPVIARDVFFGNDDGERHNLPAGAFDEVLRMADNFARSYILDRDTICDFEAPWAIQIGDNEYFLAIIDLLHIDRDRAIIIDHKTDHWLRSQEDVERDFQLRAYAWAVWKQYPHIQEFEVRLNFVRHQKERWTEFDLDTVRETEERLFTLINQVKQERNFPALPGKQCQWCGYADRCPAVQKLKAAGALMVTTEDEARRIAGEIEVLQQQIKLRQEALKQWCGQAGSVNVGGVSYGFFLTESETVDDVPGFISALRQAGASEAEILRLLRVDGRAMKGLKDEGLRAAAAPFLVDKSYTRFTSRKAGGAEDAA